MRVIFTVLILLNVLIRAAHAVELQVNQRYSAHTLVESSPLGVAFTIPEGWIGMWPSGTETFVLETLQQDLTLILVFDTFSQSNIVEMMAEPIPLGEGIYLMPNATPTNQATHYENSYDVQGAGQLLDAFIAARTIRDGLSLASMLLGSTLTDKAIQQTVALTTTMDVREPRAIPLDPNAQSWQQYMQGRYIVRYYTGSGYREKHEMWLCSDGSFATNFNSGGYSMDGFSGAFGDNTIGRWEAQGSINQVGILQLTYNNGERNSYQIELHDSLFLNGTKWLRGDNERCQ